MSKLDLKDVTLVCADDRDPQAALEVIRHCLDLANFHDVLFFTSDTSMPYSVNIPIKSIEQYCALMFRDLHVFVESSHCLIVQHDGYILNPNAWTDDFLKYDYIGAPWWYEDEYNVGNGGFSLRSKKLLEETSKIGLITYTPEDHLICRVWGQHLKDSGIVFAPEDVAKKFSIEHCGKFGRVWDGEFGFHSFGTDISKAEKYKQHDISGLYEQMVNANYVCRPKEDDCDIESILSKLTRENDEKAD